MKLVIFLTLVFYSLISICQDKPAYVIYNSQGKKVKYSKMLKDLKSQDMLFFGELHNNPISHWLQLELTKDIYASRDIIMGAEMFETDNQNELDQYLEDKLDMKGLNTLARLWPNFNTDYAPLVNYAKVNKIVFVATNVPRKYAVMVNHGGFKALDSLNYEEKKWIAPLPIPFDSTISSYQNILDMMGSHGTMNLVRAQALKDATMANSILRYYNKTNLFIHFNGSYHSDYHEGIIWYINQYRPGLNISNITTVMQPDNKKLDNDHIGSADYIICVDEDMTSTY